MDDDQPQWTCPHCSKTTHHPQDIEHHYCGFCHHFCDDQYRAPALNVYAAVISPECRCAWFKIDDDGTLLLTQVSEACPHHRPGGPFDATVTATQ
jgi:hypothetical protein